MSRSRLSGWYVLAAIALVAVAAWPFLGAQRAGAARPYFAPVQQDYRYRDQTVAFYERRIQEDPQDQISARMLAAEYMQRYREAQDVGDILRAIHQAKRSLALQPQNNASAEEIAASGYYALHEFRTALRYESIAHADQPDDWNAPSQMALLEMEMGHYALALHDLSAAKKIKADSSIWAAQARYDELTGRLDEAKRLMAAAAQQSDGYLDDSAVSRAWYHYRLGQMDFSSGQISESLREERFAISEFPEFEMAYRALARFCWGIKDWHCALDAAQKGAAIIPEPETLGYEADAQRALGDVEGARETQELIFAVERIGNAYGINDRLLSVYYSEHGVRLDDSVRIALREVRKRGGEIHAQDTLAWAAAMDGKWPMALRAAREATRYNIQDPRVQFHAGMIALHFDRIAEARRRLQEALALNPQFDPFYADLARKTLERINSP